MIAVKFEELKAQFATQTALKIIYLPEYMAILFVPNYTMFSQIIRWEHGFRFIIAFKKECIYLGLFT